ncbi:hypothetical protein RGQ29_019974 [Quercus rubra]|uniref:Peptidase S26 domain-containing protein n=1 Tax=Quercus rubra TaxID=3512 RepID=A0AAN7ITR9_QUERU|nr:hypothetical protein RGQ29_019974 [Quercus rubra]
MVLTFNLTGDMFLAERLSIKFGKVDPGDIFLLRSPESPRKVMVKRLLGLESHSVTYVPKGHVWVEGDNIYNSRDSRQFGPVPYGLLEGKVFCKIWPPKEFGSLMKSRMKDPDL